jgi:cytoskeletal protein CcmA (bactofilin family)
MALQRHDGVPVAADARSGQAGPAPDAAPKLLIVGPDITLSGEITACDRLVVQGTVRVTLNRTRAIEIAASGRFTEGRAEVEEADIGGLYEGELTVSGRLLIRSTGQVSGRVRYGELEIERGGRLAGSVDEVLAPAATEAPVAAQPAAGADEGAAAVAPA